MVCTMISTIPEPGMSVCMDYDLWGQYEVGIIESCKGGSNDLLIVGSPRRTSTGHLDPHWAVGPPLGILLLYPSRTWYVHHDNYPKDTEIRRIRIEANRA